MTQNFASKILDGAVLPAWRSSLRQAGKALVVTNGCFDLLHIGHAHYLQEARNLGDALLVGVNADWAVKELKGDHRPINDELSRAGLLAALEAVDAVYIFPELRATEFLTLSEPDIYVKGGDYTVDSIPQEERRAVESKGGKIQFLKFLPGHSSSSLLEKLKRL